MSRPFTSLPSWVLSSASNRAHQILHQHLAAAGVDGYGYRCLSALTDVESLSQTELGVAAALDPRDVTHTVRRLEVEGFVQRAKDPNHGRKVLVSLTGEGKNVAKELGKVMANAQARIFGGLSADERQTLIALLERVGR